MQIANIVIFGEVGAGKSSVINLMAGREIAEVSPDSHRSTLHWTDYVVTFDNGTRYRVFDTVGLGEPYLEAKEYSAITNAYVLINALKMSGGINLLLFCIRGGRVTVTMKSNYRLFFEFLCEEKVPLALVVTHLERERNMEDWYTRNAPHLKIHNILSVGHACITAATTLDGRHRDKFEESRRIVCSLVQAHCNASVEGWTGGQGWFTSLIGKQMDFITGRPKKTDIIGVLTKRCGIPKEAAQQMAQSFRGDFVLPNLVSQDGDKSLLNVDARDPKNENDASASSIIGQSFLNVDATNHFAQLAVNDITEDSGRDDPYHKFFASSSSQCSLPSPRRSSWLPFSFTTRPTVNESMPLRDLLKHRFFARRTPSISPLHAPENSEQTKSTPEGKVAAGNEEHDSHVDLPDCCANITPSTAETNSKEREDISSPAEIGSDNQQLWKLLMRARGRGTTSCKKAPANVGHNPCSGGAESGEDGVSQALPSSDAGPAHKHMSSQVISGQAGVSVMRKAPVLTLSTAHRVWNTFIPSRYRPQRTGPRPVTVYAARPKKLYYIAPRPIQSANQSAEPGDVGRDSDANAQTVQLPLMVVQPSAGQSDSGSYMIQSPQMQDATQPTQEEYDFCCWTNFYLWCIRRVVPAAHLAALSR